MENNEPVSVITRHAYLKLNKNVNIQQNPELKPRKWIYETLTQEQENQYVNYTSRYQNYFRATRNDLIDLNSTRFVNNFK